MMGTLQAGYGLDEDGYIISDVGLDKIGNVYFPCIEDSVVGLLRLFPQLVHSIYVYGSVARGESVAAKSDLDLLALFNGALSTEQKAEMKTFAKAMSEKHKSLVRDVGIAVSDYDYVTDPVNYYEQAFIKELCVCVHGKDLRERFGPYKLVPEIALSFNGDIAEVLARTIVRLKTAPPAEFKVISQNFSRKLIRTYYSMVMARSQIWSTRLVEQSEIFLRYFPQKELIINTLHEWVEEPSASREQVLDLFRREGEWAASNFRREALITS